MASILVSGAAVFGHQGDLGEGFLPGFFIGWVVVDRALSFLLPKPCGELLSAISLRHSLPYIIQKKKRRNYTIG